MRECSMRIECVLLHYRMCSIALQNVFCCTTECVLLHYRMCSIAHARVQHAHMRECSMRICIINKGVATAITCVSAACAYARMCALQNVFYCTCVSAACAYARMCARARAQQWRKRNALRTVHRKRHSRMHTDERERERETLLENSVQNGDTHTHTQHMHSALTQPHRYHHNGI